MTIEERAKEYCESHYDGFNCNGIESYKKGTIRDYVKGATDQDPISRADERKKVIEKACVWLIKNVTNYIEGDYFYNYDMLEKDFRQAMEE